MKRRNSNRGSAILMVVGLLSVLALLGSAFLVVTYLDRQASRAFAARSLVDPAAQGIVSTVALAMSKGLFPPGATMPYDTSSQSGAAGWYWYIDSNTGDPGTPDGWLCNNFYNQFGGSAGLVDADGNGLKDTPLFPAGLYNSMGDQYYIAYKPIDPSGLICVNTAGIPDSNYHACSVNLQGFLSTLAPSPYNSLQGARSSGLFLKDYDGIVAQRLLRPADPNCLPFSIGDEGYLRWLRASSPTETGRLYSAITAALPSGLPQGYRQLLTTYSSSRQLIPRPSAGVTVRLNPVGTDPNAIYDRALAMFQRLALVSGDVNTQRRMAASLVSNLMAYQSAGENGAPWGFTPSGQTFTTYGVIQRLVITEAYAAHKTTDTVTTPPAGDYAWGCAIEFYNPTNTPTGASDYLLDANGPTYAVPSVPAGGRIVLYNFKKGPVAVTDFKETDLGLDGSKAGWSKPTTDSAFSFLGGQTMKLVRKYPSVNVPVDQVSASDLSYNQTESGFPVAISTVSRDVQRDDDPTRARYNIAAYQAFQNDAGLVANKLGAAKALAGTPAIDAISLCGAPIEPSDRSVSHVPVDIAELCQLYLTSPTNDGRCFTLSIADRGLDAGKLGTLVDPKARSRARLDFAPFNGVILGGYTANDYPDVPIGCHVSEFFTLMPSDPTRETPSARVYGRINVNTAPPAVLARLFPDNPTPRQQITTPVGAKTVDPYLAAEYIAAYRDKRPTSDGVRNYTNRATASGITGLRLNATAVPGAAGQTVSGTFFLTPDEVAIPLTDYANTLMGWTNPAAEPPVGTIKLSQHKDYIKARDSIWRPVSNLITVNTDVLAANVYVQLGNNPAKYSWHYIVVIDRGNCYSANDSPAVILFAEVK